MVIFLANATGKKTTLNKILLRGVVLLVFVLLAAVIFFIIQEKRARDAKLIDAASEYYEELAVRKSETTMEIKADGTYLLKEDAVSAYDVVKENGNGTVLLDAAAFKDRANLISAFDSAEAGAQAHYTVDAAVGEKDLLVLQFTAYTSEGRETLTVGIDDAFTEIEIGQTPTSVFIPLTGVSKLDRISVSTDADYKPTTLEDVYLVNYGADADPADLALGTRTRDDHTTTSLPDALLSGNVKDCLIKDDVIFVTVDDRLEAYRTGEEGAQLIDSLADIGRTQRLAFNKDRSVLLVTCGMNGVYLIDVRDPADMKILSHYSTLGRSFGIYTAGDAAFVCSRRYGVEYIDISDPAAPSYLGFVGENNDCTDCFAQGTTLYIGTFDKQILIYDVGAAMKPRLLYELALDGYGQGLAVQDGVLYAATALDAQGDGGAGTFSAGTGNGLEIFDVSDPTAPKRLSRVKIDGRMNESNFNVWDVEVSAGRAYVSNSYNGLFVYDVSDPASPRCLQRYEKHVGTDDSRFRDLARAGRVYSWKTDEVRPFPVAHVVLEKNKIYAAVSDYGVVAVSYDAAAPTAYDTGFTFRNTEFTPKAPTVPGYDADLWTTDASVWAVAENDGLLYVAAGDKGIVVLDKDLKELNTVPTGYSVRDIRYKDGYLFTAESDGGVAAYRTEGSEITFLSAYLPENGTLAAVSVELAADGKTILAQFDPQKYLLIDAGDPEALTLKDADTRSVGNMSPRSIVRGTPADKYLGVFGSDTIQWYETGSDGSVRLVKTAENPYYIEVGGMASWNDKCVVLTEGGYRYYAVNDAAVSDLIKAPGAQFYGLASIGGNTLVVSQPYSRRVTIVDLSEGIDAPQLSSIFTADASPDAALVTDDMILVPCRRGGLVKLTPNQ